MTLFYRVLSLLCIAGLLAMSAAKPTRVVFFGDSITQAGVNPGGYIDKLKKMIPADQYEFIGAGIGGNKIYDLFLRMDDDVLAQKPDVVVIWVGVNDVWHKATSGTGTDPDKFVKFYEAVVKKLQAANIRVVLCTPAAIGEKTDMTNQQDGDLNQYSQFIRDMAKKQNLPLVDLRKAFQEYDLKNNPDNKDRGILTTDRVHLNETGNQFVADQMKLVLTAAK
ncbi:SGNH/GDSL hydrolase family protein [Spirosoma utsteinense]|uniref:Lysophospholipase L1-like esterase n=1 Tax=Spirosoma utsteinense TaxID=2585773 RepID=A0ABR6W8J1_9BACT|nr:GDSL-type esterase/lipase family protein [Spirosoma utsteinense]MBC3787200.1 lysophospholipase L1-like esterase [Spirosoma utsteinense]MBC3792885.1 lysophospholipase L1-like esterase [Spirosoma utsteinense]